MKKLAVSLIVVIALVMAGGGLCGAISGTTPNCHETDKAGENAYTAHAQPYIEEDDWITTSRQDVSINNGTFTLIVIGHRVTGKVGLTILRHKIDGLPVLLYVWQNDEPVLVWVRCGYERLLKPDGRIDI